MGILDEAIRQHLELKRSHGAPDSELQRMEDEAFGPPSRPGEPDFPEHQGEAAEQSGNGIAHEEASAEAAPPTVIEAGPAQASPPADEPSPEALPDQLPADEGEAGSEDETALFDQTAAPEPAELDAEAHDSPPAPEAPIESLDTVEHPMPDEDVEEEAPEEPAEEDDDVLADTPEFLKDAPEDDELWFEQGKPKDFDF